MFCSLSTAAGHTQTSQQPQQAPLTSIPNFPTATTSSPNLHTKLPNTTMPPSSPAQRALPGVRFLPATPSKSLFFDAARQPSPPVHLLLPTRKVCFLTQKRPFAIPHFPHRPQQEITRFAKGNVLPRETIGFAQQNVTFHQPKRMVSQRSPMRASPRMCPNAPENTYIYTQHTT